MESCQSFLPVVQNKTLFSAKLPTTISATVKNRVLQYNRVITNIGIAYSPRNCVFTATDVGYYLFSWSTSQYDYQLTYYALTKNRAEILNEHAHAGVHQAMDSTSQTFGTRGQSVDQIQWWKLSIHGSSRRR